MNYDWDFRALVPYWRTFAWGAVITFALAVAVVGAGIPIGLGVGLLLRARFRPLRILLTIIIDIARALPPIVLILWFYYLLPIATGFRDMPSFMIAWIALTAHLSAFVADVIRGAIGQVPPDAIDAAKALGMNRGMVIRRVIIPDVVRTSLPTLALLSIAMLRNTSLASVIAVYELMHTADRVITNTFRALEAYTVVAIIYIIIVLPFAHVGRLIERRFGISEVRL